MDYLRKIRKKATFQYVQDCVTAFRENSKQRMDRKFEREYALMTEPLSSKDDLAILLYLDQTGELDISGGLNARYGSQAVGNGIVFVLHKLFQFYFVTNVIQAAGYNQAETWDRIQLDYRDWVQQQFSSDCDFYTFVPSWRKDICIPNDSDCVCDWSATNRVLQKIFRFFVVCDLLFQKHSSNNDNMFTPMGIYRQINDVSQLRISNDALKKQGNGIYSFLG